MANPNLLPAILATLKQKESGGNYGIRAKGSSASGAYQFIDPTWRSLTHKYGIGTEYPSAYLAPPSIQDAVAQKQVSGLLSQGYGPAEVAKTWYTGNPQGQMSAAAIAANKGLTADRYAADFLQRMGKISGDTTQLMAPQGFTPNASAPQPTQIAGEPMQFPGAVPVEPETFLGLNKDQYGGLEKVLGGQEQQQPQQEQIQHFGLLGRPEVQVRQAQPFKYQGVQRRGRRGLLG